MCKYLIFLRLLIIIALACPLVISSKKQSTPLSTTDDYPKSCKEIMQLGQNASTFYYIQPKNAPEPFVVLCNMHSSGGGWTTILNRVDGSQDFFMDWDSYKLGFGNIAGEFWLGLEKLHYMAGYELTELLFEFVDWNDVQADAYYGYFGIGGEEEGYILKLLRGFN
ncbi:hypothetical protein Zmor_023247 [Zophobas morio]|uniref:Fibrinogen C-terminal domain-containing protein n=1 Tax=Zophobas morio TaxID=2755281 RepID=A0AA38M690_9CUCU|nr:hypothetical protein Zmor_023247 [Zophobas morio]